MNLSPTITLFFLSAAIAELLSGSAPPLEFFNPITFLLLSSLYGSGALIARELKIRWNKNYVSLFLLGAAYAIIEEALMVKSFFDPNWIDIGILGIYGRWLGVNWVWALWLTIYHAIFSIAIPITIIELIYPKQKNKSWINNKKLSALITLLIGVTSFGYLFLTTYRPPTPQYILFITIVGLLVVLAWKTPNNIGKETKKTLTPKKALITGLATVTSMFLLFGAGPHLISHPIILLLAGIGLVFIIFLFIKRYNWNKYTQYNKFSLTSGALVFFIILAPLQELDQNRQDNPQGMLLIGIIAMLLLLLLRKKLKQNQHAHS
jgi:uncharacterized membrane protein